MTEAERRAEAASSFVFEVKGPTNKVVMCPDCGNIVTKNHKPLFCFTWLPRNKYKKAEGH